MSNGGSATTRYTMTIALGVLNHLGLNLYSNTAAALSEAVANGWDADADQVKITLTPDKVVIEDNGIGMTLDDVNDKFLMVGYDRRRVGPDTTTKGRPIMGRKGIGKLSLFSIADDVIVQTIRDGNPQESFHMNVEAIREAIDDRRNYNPDTLAIASDLTKGTRITLTDLKNNNIAATREALRRRLARRFSVIGTEEFQVVLDGKPITYADRDDLKQVQFIWQIGKPLAVNFADEKLFPRFNKSKPPTLVEGVIDADQRWTVSGWIGTAKEPKNLKSADDRQVASLNSIVVHSRGRLIQEDLLPAISEARLIRNYLTGQVEANFLDISQKRDIATSDRQRVQEDDERYLALVAFVTAIIKNMANVWTEYRVEVGQREAIEENPALQEWIDTLNDEGVQRLARQMIGKIQAFSVDDERDRKELFRQSILAFERFNMRQQLNEFVDTIGRDSDRAILAFNTLDDLEAIMYAQIVKSRLDVITTLQQNVEERAREKVFQKLLFDHLWLLDPSWERATEGRVMEREFKTLLGDDGSVSEDVENIMNSRLDIKYRTAAGKHIIVELKKSDRTMKTSELYDQGERYRVLLAEVLSNQTSPNATQPTPPEVFYPQIEVVFIVGKMPVNSVSREDKTVVARMEPINGRVVTYNQLVGFAKKSYEEYLDQHESIARLNDLVDRLTSPPVVTAPVVSEDADSDTEQEQ